MQVRISETYDLSTQVNKMGLVAIHTPDTTAITRRWGGLLANHKYMKMVSCDVTMACASMLPADPLQVGLETGEIAPQDMFNPILYTAVSNDSFNNIINRIMYLSGYSDVANQGSSVVAINSPDFAQENPKGTAPKVIDVDNFDIYYSLLSQNGTWKKSMPQSGLSMKGLYPVVYSLVNTVGNQGMHADGGPWPADFNNVWSENVTLQNNMPEITRQGVGIGMTLRGNSMRMPAIPTWGMRPQGASGTLNPGTLDAMGEPTEIPRCYVAAIIMPPAKLNKLYYRMRVTWTIEFIAPRPYDEIIQYYDFEKIAQKSYGTDYAAQSAAMSVTTSSVDALGADVNLVMEGS